MQSGLQSLNAAESGRVIKLGKMRLDVYLTEHNLAESRSAAQAQIMAGNVYIDNQKAMKAGEAVRGDEKIEVRGGGIPYVSRGGLKLEKAMRVFPISLSGSVCMDIGASTGGFTDCMLQNGAARVYSVDVGYGQLAWKLRTDDRVVNMERTNFRYVTHDQIPEDIDFASVDVSFISLKKILPVMRNLLSDNGVSVCLIKPQFEAGRENVGKKGVVRDPKIHCAVVEDIRRFAVESGFSVMNLDFSPIKGPEGNIEYLMHIKKSNEASDFCPLSADKLVELSHSELDK